MVKKKEVVAKTRDIYDCPLYEKEVCIPECYEAQLVRAGGMKMEALFEHSFNRDKADELCDICPFNQLLG